MRIRDVYPSKAQFRRGDPVAVIVELERGDGAREEAADAELRCVVSELATEVRTVVQSVRVPPGGKVVCRLELGSFEDDFAGYGADVELLDDNRAVADRLSTAFDVVSDWRKATRYGFVSEYALTEGSSGEEDEVPWMAKLHLNLVQFYDWMYKHDQLVGPETYVDLMGREVDRRAVEERISRFRRHGMMSIAYGAVYAASRKFAEMHPDWALYTSAGEPFDFIGIFRIMDISPDSPWSGHIVGQYEDAVRRLGFDGIHMDTYGCPKTGWSRRDGKVRLERLETHFPKLIDRTRETLGGARDDVCLIFNNVGNWPVDAVGSAAQDAIYIEVWKPYERYHHLREIIDGAKRCGQGKNVILAAYLKPFREPGKLGIPGAENAMRLLTAAVTAHGAYHLLFGEEDGVLTQGYYVDHSKLREGFKRTVRDYCDFIVRYGHLMFDAGLRDVSMTHADGDNEEYRFEGFEWSAYGEPGKVWTVIREKADVKLVHFINLSGAGDDLWNEGKEEPPEVSGRVVRVAVDLPVRSVFLASPDREGGRAVPLEYRIEKGARGLSAVIELPDLRFWDLLAVVHED